MNSNKKVVRERGRRKNNNIKNLSKSVAMFSLQNNRNIQEIYWLAPINKMKLIQKNHKKKKQNRINSWLILLLPAHPTGNRCAYRYCQIKPIFIRSGQFGSDSIYDQLIIVIILNT